MKKIVLLLFYFLFVVSVRAEAIFYDVVDIAEWGGYVSINESGQIAGTAIFPGTNNHAFFYDGTVHDIGTFGGAVSLGYGFNNLGQVVGVAQDAHSTHSFIYDGSLQKLNVGPLDNFTPYDINDFGMVVGAGVDQFYHSDTRAYSLFGGVAVDLGTFRDGSSANAINNKGQIVGDTTTTGDPVTRAFIYENGPMELLNNFSGFYPNRAVDINENGSIVGDIGLGSNQYGFYYSDTEKKALNPGSGLSSTFANINDNEVIVGKVFETSRPVTSYAALFDDGFLNLNDNIFDKSWDLKDALDINNKGQIVGWGNYKGERRIFLLDPVSNGVPEPATMLLFGTGLLVAFIRRKKIAGI